MKTIVVKLGSTTVADGRGRLRQGVLGARLAEVAELAAAGHRVVVVSSGAIACGQSALGLRERPERMAELQAASAVGQGRLFAAYARLCARHGRTAAQVLLTSADFAQRRSYVNARATLRRLLAWHIVPIVNENDTTITDEIGFGDNDVLAAQVAFLMSATWLVLLTDRDGLYAIGADGAPTLIGDVAPTTHPEDVALADMRGSGLGRGGVSSKIAAATMATGAGVTCVIASGRSDGVLGAVASGHHVGTRFAPTARRESAFKLWLRYAKPSLGRVHVDAGAAQALRRQGTSLLPVGISGVDGTFAVGDAVDVHDPAGACVGKGISGFSADDLRLVVGMKSDQVRRVLPDAGAEVIHRDQFVLAESPGSR